MPDLVAGPDGRRRCAWAAGSAEYTAYHDDEWGRPVRTDDAMFERLCLEGFQAGLSWLTILRKRPAFRAAFADFAIDAVAGFDGHDVRRLLADAGIIRNRAKIVAAIANANIAAELPGGLAAYVWRFAPAEPSRMRPPTRADVPVTTAESVALAADLRRRGIRFLGPTTAYALMQATGMVDDHLAGCWLPPAEVGASDR